MTFLINPFLGAGGGGGDPFLAAVGSKAWMYLKAGVGLYTDAGSTPATSNGDLIVQWNDSSGHSRHATRTGGVNRAEYRTGTQYLGHNTIHCDSSWLDLVDMSALTEAEAFIIVKVDNDPSSDLDHAGFWSIGNSDFRTHFPFTDGVIYDGFGTTVRKTVGDPTPSLSSAFRVYNPRSLDASSPVYTAGDPKWAALLDNTSLFTTTTNTVAFRSSPTIGSSVFSPAGSVYQGFIAAFAICTPILTTSERNAAYTALTT